MLAEDGWIATVGGVVVMNRKNLWGLRLVSRNISWGISSVGEGMPWRFSLQICRPFWGGCHDCVWEFLIDNFGGNSVPGYDYFLRGSRPVSRDMELVLGRAGSCWGWSWEGAVSCYPGEYWEVIRERGVQRRDIRDLSTLLTTPHWYGPPPLNVWIINRGRLSPPYSLLVYTSKLKILRM